MPYLVPGTHAFIELCSSRQLTMVCTDRTEPMVNGVLLLVYGRPSSWAGSPAFHSFFLSAVRSPLRIHPRWRRRGFVTYRLTNERSLRMPILFHHNASYLLCYHDPQAGPSPRLGLRLMH